MTPPPSPTPGNAAIRRRRLAVALLALLLPATAARAAAPYPASPTLLGVDLDWSTYRRLAPGSDQWPMTQAADGRVYTSFQDGGGFATAKQAAASVVSIGVASVSGTASAASFSGRNLIGGYRPSLAKCFPLFPGDMVDKRKGSPCRGIGRAGKSVGLLALDGQLYAWVSPGSGPQAYAEARLYKAPLGTSKWRRAAWAFQAGDPSPITYPAFVQAGPGLASGDPAWVYLYAAGLAPLDPKALTVQRGPLGGEIHLMRAARGADLMRRDSYEFFAGLDAGGLPTWTRDPAAKRAAFVDPAGVSPKTSAAYLPPPIDRYLLMTEHGAYASGRIGLFAAPAPWGPWHTVAYDDTLKGAGAPPDVGTVFLAGLVPGSLDAETGGFTLAFSGLDRTDALNLVDGRFGLNEIGQPGGK